MVIVMRLNHLSGDIKDFIHKPQRESAHKLHKLFDKNSAPFKIPTARELILESLQFDKWCSIEYAELCGDIGDSAEIQELCKLINVDWQDIDASVIDAKYLSKQKKVN